jgi:cysteine sulfinate desulfinase/cysteine desulfurase-like protein
MAHRSLGTFPGGAVRFSLGPANTLEEIRAAAAILWDLAGRAP